MSIIIPAYNEEKRIGATLNKLGEALTTLSQPAEIIVVLDGCTDNTAHVIDSIASTSPQCPIITVTLPENGGKGAAIRAGVQAARGNIIGFTDADLPYSLDTLPDIRTMLETRNLADIVIGNREDPLSTQSVRPPFIRRLAGRIYSRILNAILRIRIRDTQCGFKFFTRDAAHKIFAKSTINGFGIDAEILYIAKQNALRITQIPVNLQNLDGSSVRLCRDSCRMLRETFIIRLRGIRRYYQFRDERDHIEPGYQKHALNEGHPVQRAWHANRMDTLAHTIQPQQGARVLDVGSGAGLALQALPSAAGAFIALDADLGMLRYVKQNSNGHNPSLVMAFGQTLPFAPNTFTHIICQEFIEHLPQETILHCLREFNRVLTDDGTLFLTTPNYKSLWPAIEYTLDALHLTPRMGGDQHISRMTPSSLRALLQQANFETNRLTSFNLISPWAALISTSLARRLHRLETRFPSPWGSLLCCCSQKRNKPLSAEDGPTS